MLTRLIQHPWLVMFAALCSISLLLVPPSLAARNFERLNFTFSEPATLRLASAGNTVTLQFSKPVTFSRDALAQQLGARATHIAMSTDKKKVTLTLDKPYRVRQFISGTTVGVDILTGEPSKQPADHTTKASAAPADTAEPTASVMSTKAETPPPPVPAAAPLAVEPPPPDHSQEAKQAVAPLSTKETPSQSVMTTKEPPAASAPQPEPIASPTPPASQDIQANKKVAAAIEPPAMESASAPGVFTVTTRATDDGVWMNFPWEKRTAAAVFERGEDIWVVFTAPQTISTSVLHSALPKAITRVDQFQSRTHTILRLSTDGSVHATARQPKGSYRWNILLSPRRMPASLEAKVESQNDGDKHDYLLVDIFDTGAPLRFYDPRIGDLTMVFASHDEGRGVSNPKSFPGLEILATQQGVVIVSQRDDVKADPTRVGLKISAPQGLAVSQNLPTLTPASAPIKTATTSDILFPYDAWYVAPQDYLKVRAERLRAIANATPSAKPDALYAMVTLALGQGFASEALGYLDLIRLQFPDYYAVQRLSLLRAASNLLLTRPKEAAADAAAPELEGLEEAKLWREAIGLYFPVAPVAAPTTTTPAQGVDDNAVNQGTLSNVGADATQVPDALATIVGTAAPFDYLQYNTNYIRFYPPRIRQHLAQMAAEYYLKAGDDDKALAVYDTLNRDGILKPIQNYAELTLGKIAANKSQVKQALEILERLAQQHDDRFVQAQASYETIMLRYKNELASAQETTEALERLRLRWRGDWFERKLLSELTRLYTDTKQYDQVLRTLKYTLQAFPADADSLTLTGDMSELFADMFLGGLADDMPPLKSLALFYEFRELTPIGERGDAIIQRLADRLAAVDLLSRAAQLLDHQVKFRVGGEQRARVGARLALLYLLNQEPQRALDALQTTNFGGAPIDLQRERQQLMAKALSNLGKHEEALAMLYADPTRPGGLLRLDILWAMQDWPNIVNQSEDVLAARANLTDPLTPEETQVLLKLALAYSFEGDYTQLGYLRDYYMNLVPDSPMKEIFSFITNDTSPLDAEDFNLVTKQIQNTEGFLSLFKEKIAQGRLSEAI